TPAVFFSACRGSRPPSFTMSSISTPDGSSRADTVSPGSSIGKPSTSNPQATFDTVAGANAVTTSSDMRGPIEPRRSRRSQSVICVIVVVRNNLPSADVSSTNRGNEVLAEGAIEIVLRVEAPVASGGRVVHVGRPGIDDCLPLLVDLVRNRRARKL